LIANRVNVEQALSLGIRYLLLLIIGVNIAALYVALTPATVYPVYLVLQAMYDAVLVGPQTIAFKGYFANIVAACVGGAAYYFLLILNLTTPMKNTMRLKSLVFLLASFYVLNVARIIGFGILFSKGYRYFDFTHLATWYFGSTLLVVVLWFVNVRLFHIDTTPLYSDVQTLLSEVRDTRRGNI